MIREHISWSSVKVQQLLILVACALLWWVLPPIIGISPIILPKLSTVLTTGASDAANENLLRHAIVTLREIGVAYLIATVAGVLSGVVVGASVTFRRIVLPYLNILFAVPVITLIPLFLITLGIGERSKIAFGAIYGLFPILYNTVLGMSKVRPVHVELQKAFGLSLPKRYYRVILPTAARDILNGMQISLSITIVAVISAEMFGSLQGLGYLIQKYSQLLNGPAMWFIIILTLVFSFLLLRILSAIAKLINVDLSSATYM